MSSGRKLLITGATGYIGGSVSSLLLSSSDPTIKTLQISVTVRRQDQADVFASKGIKPIFINDLDDSEALSNAAREHDIVINSANSFHTASAKALIMGLGERKKQTGQEVHFIQTSGTSNLGDKPVTKEYIETREFSDKENIYLYEDYREDMDKYDQRTTELTVIRTGESVDVPTHVIMSPLIYGFGNGLFNKVSIQVPKLINVALSIGSAVHVGEGLATWDHVHVTDLAALYVILLSKILSGADVPSGKKGIYFTGTGRHTWRELAQRIGKAGLGLGALNSAEPIALTVKEFADSFGGGNTQRAELGFASRSLTSADLAAGLGWKPRKTEVDWEDSIVEDFKHILDKNKTSA